MKKSTLIEQGNWFRGNLHTHSTISDGEYTPEELKRLYKQNGYSFLAVTDHNTCGIYTDLNDPDFLMIPGLEVDCRHDFDTGVDHIVGIAKPGSEKMRHLQRAEGLKNKDAQTIIDFLRSTGHEAIYAHPFWSYTKMENLLALKGLLGVEIINYSCEQEWKSGIGEVYLEQLWAQNRPVFAFGSDDAHMHVPDFLGGYISVKAEALTYESIFNALKCGSFTASYARPDEEAPRLYDFYVEDGVAHLRCSPCAHICLNVDRNRYEPAFSDTDTLTEHSWVLPENAASVRAVLQDARRNTTWSQPILLKGGRRMERIGLSLPPKCLLPEAATPNEARIQREIGSPQEILQFVKELGVEQIELRPVKWDADPSEILTVARTIWQSGLTLSVHAAFPKAEGAFSAVYPSLLPLLREAPSHQGAVTLTFHALLADAAENLPRAARQTAERLALYAQEADTLHFTLALEENRQKSEHDPCNTCEGVEGVLSALPDAPVFGACFDFGHFYSNARKNHPDDRATADALRPPVSFCRRAIHTHIHAYNGSTHQPFLPPNELPLAEYLTNLRQAEYTGVYNLELDYPRFPDTPVRLAIEASVSALKAALNA